jgi:hypothetical protein
MNVMPLEVIIFVKYFKCPEISNKNVANVRTYEVGATLSPLSFGSWGKNVETLGNRVYMCESMWHGLINVAIRWGYIYRSYW